MAEVKLREKQRLNLAALPLRLMLGCGFVYHGAPKLFSGEGHAAILGMLQQIGVPLPGLMSWVVGLVEFFGGLALIIGAFIPVVTPLLILNMLVAMLTVHWNAGFNFLNITGITDAGPTFGMPGYEVNLLYTAGLLALLLDGAGPLSFDKEMSKRRQTHWMT